MVWDVSKKRFNFSISFYYYNFRYGFEYHGIENIVGKRISHCGSSIEFHPEENGRLI